MICNFEKSYFDFDLFADGSWGWPDVGQLTTRHRELADDRWWSIFYHPSIDLRRVAPNENSSSRCSGIKQTVHSPTKPNDHRIFCEQTLSARSSFLESASFSKCRLEAPFYFRERTNRWKKKKKRSLWSTFLDTTDMLARLESRGERRLQVKTQSSDPFFLLSNIYFWKLARDYISLLRDCTIVQSWNIACTINDEGKWSTALKCKISL